MHAGKPVGRSYDYIGCLEGGFRVPALQAHDPAYVGRAPHRLRLRSGFGPGAMHRGVAFVGCLLSIEHPRRPFLHRLLGVDDRGQRFVVDVDQGSGIPGGGLGLGDHRRHRLAGEEDPPNRQRLLRAGRGEVR